LCLENKSLDVVVKLKKEGKAKFLKNLIAYDEVPEDKLKAALEAELKIYRYSEVIEAGKTHKEAPV